MATKAGLFRVLFSHFADYGKFAGEFASEGKSEMSVDRKMFLGGESDGQAAVHAFDNHDASVGFDGGYGCLWRKVFHDVDHAGLVL